MRTDPYTASIQITHCAGPSSTDSADFFKLNKFSLDALGNITSADYAYGFTDNTVRIPFQMALWNSKNVFLDSPDLNLTKEERRLIRDSSWHTQGKFTAGLEYRLLPASGQYRLGEFSLPKPPYRMFLTPEYGAHGTLTATTTPEIWGNLPASTGAVGVTFEWDNCCGKRSWRYSIEPTGLPEGPNRTGRGGQEQYPGTVVPEEE